MEPWILASASPQRTRQLTDIGVAHDVVPANVDEDGHPELDPPKRAVVLAEEKAKSVAKKMPGRFVIGCDTLVVAPDGTLLEKPKDQNDARRMLAIQSGGTSIVHSGLTIATPDGTIISDLSSSKVSFRLLTDKEIDWWMKTGLWEGRSGSFQIDGLGQLLIEHLEGDFTSVVGFPVHLFGLLAAKAGRPLI